MTSKLQQALKETRILELFGKTISERFRFTQEDRKNIIVLAYSIKKGDQLLKILSYNDLSLYNFQGNPAFLIGGKYKGNTLYILARKSNNSARYQT